MPKKVLGRGLNALIPQADQLSAPGAPPEGTMDVPVDRVVANPRQPRTVFDRDTLQDLAQSIKRDGILQPIVVRRKNDEFELIMGERRLQASRIAGKKTIPAIIRDDLATGDSLRLALVENIQRENLNAIEVAEAYRLLIAEFGLSQQDVAAQVGRDRSSIANSIRLLNLPEEVQHMISEGQLSGGHARALLSLPTRKEQLALARKVVERGMSVRDVEVTVGLKKKQSSSSQRTAKEKPAHVADLERSFSSYLGTRVSIDERRGGKGRIVVEFYSHEDFERLAATMNVPLPR